MNLSDFRARVSGAVGISNVDSSTEQGLIDDWANEAVVDFLRRTKMFTRTAQLSLTADQYIYTLDTDILSFKNIWVEPASGTSYMLDPRSVEDILYMRTLVTPSYAPMYYALEGTDVLMLHPAPQASTDVLHITYVPRPTAMSATSDAPSATANGGIPSEYHQVLEAYVKFKAADYVDDESSQHGQRYLQEYMAGVTEAKIDTLKKAGIRLAPIKPGMRNRRRGIPRSPGVDMGY